MSDPQLPALRCRKCDADLRDLRPQDVCFECGSPVAISMPRAGGVSAAPVSLVEDDLHCARCVAPLGQSREDGACGVCNLAVAETRRFRAAPRPLLCHADVKWLRQVATSAPYAHRGVIAMILGIALESISRRFEPNLYPLAAAYLVLIGGATAISRGMWDLTSRLAGEPPHHLFMRFAIRAGAITLVLTTLAPALSRSLPPELRAVLRQGAAASVIHTWHWIAWPLLLLYVASLARRIPDTPLHALMRNAGIALLASSATVAVVAVWLMFAGETDQQRLPLLPPRSAYSCACLILLGLAALAALPAFVLGACGLAVFSRALRRQLELALKLEARDVQALPVAELDEEDPIAASRATGDFSSASMNLSTGDASTAPAGSSPESHPSKTPDHPPPSAGR